MTLNEGTKRDDSCVSCVCLHSGSLPNASICGVRDGKAISAFFVNQSTFTQPSPSIANYSNIFTCGGAPIIWRACSIHVCTDLKCAHFHLIRIVPMCTRPFLLYQSYLRRMVHEYVLQSVRRAWPPYSRGNNSLFSNVRSAQWRLRDHSDTGDLSVSFRTSRETFHSTVPILTIEGIRSLLFIQ